MSHHSTPCVLCETLVSVVVKFFNHNVHEGFTKVTRRRVDGFYRGHRSCASGQKGRFLYAATAALSALLLISSKYTTLQNTSMSVARIAHSNTGISASRG